MHEARELGIVAAKGRQTRGAQSVRRGGARKAGPLKGWVLKGVCEKSKEEPLQLRQHAASEAGAAGAGVRLRGQVRGL